MSGRRHLLDDRAQVLERRERGLDRRDHLRIALLEEERARDADPAAPDAALDVRAEIGDRARRRGRIARIVAGERLEHERGILHRAGERPGVILRPGKGQGAELADPAEGRLDAHEVAAGGRLADRGAGIAAHRGMGHARGDRRRRAAARAARMMIQPPGIAHWPVMGVRAGRAVGELVQVGLADQHRARALQALDRGRVEVGHPVREQRRAVGGGDASGRVQVLDRDRDAVQGPEMVAGHDRRLGGVGGGAGALRRHRDEGVQLRLQPLDPGKRRLGHLDRRQLLGGEARRQLRDAGEDQVLTHRRLPR